MREDHGVALALQPLDLGQQVGSGERAMRRGHAAQIGIHSRFVEDFNSVLKSQTKYEKAGILGREFQMKLSPCLGLAAALVCTNALAAPLATVARHGSYIAVEPFASNVVHVTIAIER